MSEFKLIAVDDEEPSLKLIEWFTGKLENIEYVKGFSNPLLALEFINQEAVDIIVLDIEMKGLNGLDFSKQKADNSKVIFSTAYAAYALEGFKVSAVDYLLKPYRFERFKEAIQKAANLIRLEQDFTSNKEANEITIKVNYVNRVIRLDDILYLESLNNNVILHLVDGNKLEFRDTLKRLMSVLPSASFKRVHRSYLVNFSKVTSFTKSSLCLHDIKLPIGESYKVAFDI